MSFSLKVKTMGCPSVKELTLDVNKEQTVPSLRTMLAEKTGVPVNQQRLIFLGKVLKDEQKLGDYPAIKEGSTIHMVKRPAPTAETAEPAPAAAPTPSPAAAPVPEALTNMLDSVMGAMQTFAGNTAAPTQPASSATVSGQPTRPSMSVSQLLAELKDKREFLTMMADSTAEIERSLAAGGALDTDESRNGVLSLVQTYSDNLEKVGSRLTAFSATLRQVGAGEVALVKDGETADARTVSQPSASTLPVSTSTSTSVSGSPSSATVTTTTTTRTEVPAASAAANPLAGLMQNLMQPQGNGQNGAPANPLAAMMGQLMGTLNQPGANGQANPMAQMMQGLMGNLQQARSGQTSAANDSASPMDQTLASVLDLSDAPGPVQEVLRVVAASLTLSEAMAVLQGDWGPMAKVQPKLAAYVKELLEEDLSPVNTQQFAASVIHGLAGGMSEKTLPPQLLAQVAPGKSVTGTTLQVVEESIPRMIRLVTSGDGSTFAVSIRGWTTNLIGKLMERLSASMVTGEAGALELVQYFAAARVAQIRPDMADVVGGMLKNSVARIYGEYKAARERAAALDMDAVMAESERIVIDDDDDEEGDEEVDIDEEGWFATIAEDVTRQRQLPAQRPFSDAYLQGMPPLKRQKVAGGPAHMLQARVKEATRRSEVLKRKDGATKDALAEAGGQEAVVDLYVHQLAKDIRQRLLADPDFDRKKFPNAAKLLDEEKE